MRNIKFGPCLIEESEVDAVCRLIRENGGTASKGSTGHWWVKIDGQKISNVIVGYACRIGLQFGIDEDVLIVCPWSDPLRLTISGG